MSKDEDRRLLKPHITSFVWGSSDGPSENTVTNRGWLCRLDFGLFDIVGRGVTPQTAYEAWLCDGGDKFRYE